MVHVMLRRRTDGWMDVFSIDGIEDERRACIVLGGVGLFVDLDEKGVMGWNRIWEMEEESRVMVLRRCDTRNK